MYQRKSDGRWCENVNGHVIYGKTQRELKQKLIAYTGKVENGFTVAEALEAWVKYKEPDISYKTYEGYTAPIKRINAVFGERPAKDIQPSDIQAFINSLAKQGYKRSTVQRPLNILSMLYDWLITQPGALVKNNPCGAVRLPNGLKQERRELAAENDIQRIKDNVCADFGLFAFLLLYTGLRKGEALALRYEDINRESGYISVNKSVSWQTNQPVVKEPKTEAGVREVVLLNQLAEVLPKSKRGYIFSPDGGKSPLTQIEFRHRWDNYCRVAGLCDVSYEQHTNPSNKHTYTKTVYTSRVTPHQLRHEFARLCFDAGLEERDTQNIMGHANISTTHAVYDHIRESRRQKSISKLQNYVDGAI